MMDLKKIKEEIEHIDLLKDRESIAIFGSARTDSKDPVYTLAHDMAMYLSEEGYDIVTGGGPGIMEAANRGAKRGKGTSIGVSIQLPQEQDYNPYIEELIEMEYFFTRKATYIHYPKAFIHFQGGYGTLDELFEVLTLIQTEKIPKVPVIVVGTRFWAPLLEWIEDKLAIRYKTIDRDDPSLIQLIDTVEELKEIL